MVGVLAAGRPRRRHGVRRRAAGAGGAAPKVTDPKEMLARSLQATLDASAVRFDGTITGTIPGSLVDRPEADREPRRHHAPGRHPAQGREDEGAHRERRPRRRPRHGDGLGLRVVPRRAGGPVVQGIARRRVGRGGRRHQPAHAGRPPAQLPRGPGHDADHARRPLRERLGTMPRDHARRGLGPGHDHGPDAAQGAGAAPAAGRRRHHPPDRRPDAASRPPRRRRDERGRHDRHPHAGRRQPLGRGPRDRGADEARWPRPRRRDASGS